MRDGRSLRDPHFFACFITTAFPKLRTLPQSPTATAPSRREPFIKHILPLSLVYFSSPAIASFEPRDYRVVFCYKNRTAPFRGGPVWQSLLLLRFPFLISCFSNLYIVFSNYCLVLIWFFTVSHFPVTKTRFVVIPNVVEIRSVKARCTWGLSPPLQTTPTPTTVGGCRVR